MKPLNRPGLFKIAALLAMLAVAAGCATNPVSGRSDFVLMSEQREIALGAQNHQQILKQYKVYEHPQLQQYVNEVGQKLAQQSHRNHLEFRFTLLDSPEVNAFALPGGYIYITRGIMAYMNNEEQLAGVLGHEIGHVTARHGVRQQSAQVAAGIIGLIATIASGDKQVAEASNQLGDVLISGYGRNHELEADRLGAEYLARTDYDPEKMLGVVGILKNQEEFELQRAREEGREPRVYHGVFSTHPRNDRRLQEVIRAADKFKNPDARATDPENFLRLMNEVAFGESEEQGIIRENKFYHKAMDFVVAFPQDWRIENQPNQLVAIRADGAAAMIVNTAQLEGGESTAQFLNRKFSNLQKGQSVDGGGYTGIATGKHPLGDGPYRVVTVPHQGYVFVVAGFAKSQRPDQLFVDTATSIRKLKNSEHTLAQAQKIRLLRAKSGDTFALLAKQTDLGRFAEERLRLLNGLYPDGEPANGQLIKIIQ
ncbi:M48 family metalloprotease [Candidatus Spongiihabitans sp.]|uniref:M48 family metalloprotease n=1 Tax=Candidatus Spongiihabitans sp. TaxID=3101308 RepID=UPI003C70518B